MAPPGRKIPLGDAKGGRWPYRPPFEKIKDPPPAAAGVPLRNTTAAGGGRGWADGGKKERDEPPPRQNLRIAPPGRKVPLGDAKGGDGHIVPLLKRKKESPLPLRRGHLFGIPQQREGGRGRADGRADGGKKLGEREGQQKTSPAPPGAGHLRKSSMGQPYSWARRYRSKTLGAVWPVS